MKKFCLVISLLIFPTLGFSLSPDQTLRASILSISSSKRTILLNKGSEEGLEVGNHAKFYIESENLMARAIIRKISPSRSLWSVYRLLETGQLEKYRVINLTITTPLPLTDDNSKSLLGEKSKPIEIREVIPKSIGKDSYKTNRALPYIPTDTNYSNLSAENRENKDPNVDFSELDEEKKLVQGRFDYSSLNEHLSLPNKKDLSDFESLEEKVLMKPDPKIIDEEYAGLMDFVY